MVIKKIAGLLYPDAMDGVTPRSHRLENTGEPNKDFIYALITRWQHDPQRNVMFTAQDYYKNKNDIKDRKRTYVDREGVTKEIPTLSNTQLSHPLFKKLVNQKVNYILSKEFSVQTENDQFAKELQPYLTPRFYKLIKNVAKDAVINGIGWVVPYYNTHGELNWKRISPDEVIPLWQDSEHEELGAVLRFYKITAFDREGGSKEVEKVEYWTNEGSWFYEVIDGKLEKDPNKPETYQSHFKTRVVKRDQQGEETTDIRNTNWSNIPYIPFKYNSEEISLIQWTKSLLDNYDLLTSDNANNLLDLPNSIKIVRNYDGDQAESFTHNLAQFRTVFVSTDGGVESLETPLAHESLEAHLRRLRKDIYEAANGVDTQEENMGNASGVALKFRYSDLDSDADDMINEFTDAIKDLIWFVQTDIQMKGKGDFTNEEFMINFNTTTIVNEREIVEEARNSLGIISDETIIANHPWVLDTTAEMKRIEEQREREAREMQEMMEQEQGSGTYGNPLANQDTHRATGSNKEDPEEPEEPKTSAERKSAK